MHRDWTRTQHNELCSNAAIKLLSFGTPSPVPPASLDYFPALTRPDTSNVLDIVNKGKLYAMDDDIFLLVRLPTPSPLPEPDQPSGHAARLLGNEPIRVYVPLLMRPWSMRACHTTVSCHLGITHSLCMLASLYWSVGIDAAVRWWLRHCFKCQARKTPGQTVRWPMISLPLPDGSDVVVSV